MKNCFKFEVKVADGTEVIPMRGKDLEDAQHKVKKLPQIVAIIKHSQISPSEYFRLKEEKKDPVDVPDSVDSRTVVMTADHRPFANLK
jgi:hypothetical protein